MLLCAMRKKIYIYGVYDRLCVFSTEWFCKVGLSMGAPSFNIHQ